MKKLIILMLISQASLLAEDITYKSGAIAGKTPDAVYLSVKAPRVSCGQFSIKLRDINDPQFSSTPTKTWQHILEQDQSPHLFGLTLKAYRVLQDGSSKEVGKYPLVTQYRTADTPQTVGKFTQYYDYAGPQPGDHYRIYCVKTYIGQTSDAPRYQEEYVDCRDVIYYDVLKTNLNCWGIKGTDTYYPLYLKTDQSK